MIEAEDAVARPASSAYVPFSERDPRKKLEAVVEGAGESVEDGAGEGESVFSTVVAYVVSAFVAVGVFLGIVSASRRPEISSEPRPANPNAKENGVLRDASHLDAYEPGRRARLVGFWKSMPEAFKKAALEAEARGVLSSSVTDLPSMPPKLWSAKLSALLDRQAERKYDLTTANGIFDEAKFLEKAAGEFADLQLFKEAADSAIAAGRLHEILAGNTDGKGKAFSRESFIRSVEVYRTASYYADQAGSDVQRSSALRNARRIWVKARLAEQFKIYPELLDGKVEAVRMADAMSRRADADPAFAFKLIEDISSGDKRLFNYPVLKENWELALEEVKGELGLGLRLNWRTDIERFFLLNEEPGYKSFQGQGWYEELTNDTVAEFAPKVLKALEDPAFREKHLKAGVVSEDGLQAIYDADRERITAAPSGKTAPASQSLYPLPSEKSLGLDPSWKTGIEKFFLLNEEPGYEDFKAQGWYAEMAKDAVDDFAPYVLKALKDAEFRAIYLKDGFVTEEGLQAVYDMRRGVAAKAKVGLESTKSAETAVASTEVAAVLKKSIESVMPQLLADREMRGYINSLSAPEKEAFLLEQVVEWNRSGRRTEFGSWMKVRIKSLTQIEFAEIAREAADRAREKKARRVRGDRSKGQKLIEHAKKKGK